MFLYWGQKNILIQRKTLIETTRNTNRRLSSYSDTKHLSEVFSPFKLKSWIISNFISFLTYIYEFSFMFICSFMGILKLTNCNYINFLFSFIGIAFAFSKLLDTFAMIKKAEKEVRKCQRSFGDFQKDVLVKTDAKFLGYTVSFIKDLKEERRWMTEGRRKKDEMVGLEPTNGQVWICMI